MCRLKFSVLVVGVCLFACVQLRGQQTSSSNTRSAGPVSVVPVEPDSPGASSTSAESVQAVVPRLMKFSGVLNDHAGKPVTGTVDITFSLYNTEAGGAPLWFETQSVFADEQGRYTALLGAMHTDGLPIDLFTSGEIRWLGIQVGLEAEQLPRVLLVSVPYALKAGDAETLGGKPASAYMLSESQRGSSSTTTVTAGTSTSATKSAVSGGTDQKTRTANATPLIPCSILTSGGGAPLNGIAKFTTACNLENSALTEIGGNVGINTSNPLTSLHVHSAANVNAGLDALAGDARFSFFNDAGTANIPLRLQASTVKFFNGGGALQTLTIDPTGNVGIRTPNPLTTLQVHSATNVNAGLDALGRDARFSFFNDAGTANIPLRFQASTVKFFNAGGSQQTLTIDPAGNVGIGTAGPDSKLVVTGAGAGLLRIGDPGCGGSYTGLNLTGQELGGCNTYNLASSPADPSLYLNRPTGAALKFRENNQDEVVILPGGNVGIGTATPGYKLDVNGTARFSGAVTFTGGQTISGNFNLPLTTGPGVCVVTAGGAPFMHTCCHIENTSLGIGAGNLSTTAYYLTAVGAYALSHNTTGGGNTANGVYSLLNNTEGYSNTAVGYAALKANTTGNYNLAAGTAALLNSVADSYNVASGPFSLYYNNGGDFNSANGAFALYSNTSGNYNTGSGYYSLYDNLTGGANSAFGFGSLHTSTGSNNVGVGYSAGSYNTTGSNNTFVGSYAQPDPSTPNLNYATAIGANAVVSQSNSLVLGGTGEYAVKVGIGTHAPASLLTVTEAANTDHGLQVTDGTVASNIFIQPLTSNLSGFQAINFNGYWDAGEKRVNTSKNRWRVFAEQRGALDQFSIDTYNGTAITVALVADTSGNITIPHNLTVSGTFSNPSSRRWKTNIRTLDGALEKVSRLRGVSYDWKETGKHQIGVIAEEIALIVPEVVAFDPSGTEAVGVDYARLTALLIQATQEQQAEIKAQQAQIARLTAQLAEIQASLESKRDSR